MTKIAVYPGTFDPPTYGHISLVERGACLFDKVVVAVAPNDNKSPLFSLSERMEMAQIIFVNIPNVEVKALSGLLAEFMDQEQSKIILRGIRTSGDMEYEFQLATTNRYLNPGVETVFLKPDERVTHISSSIVREIARMGAELSAFVPPEVIKAFQKKL